MNPNIRKPDQSGIVNKRTFGGDKLTMPNEIPLNSLVHHFKWDICKITPTSLQERILSVEGHLRENSSGILPQSYCLLAYLKSKADTDKKIETNNEIYSLLLNAEESLPEIDEGSTKKGLGYKAAVIGNLIYWEQSEIKKYEQARKHFEEYKKLKGRYGRNLESHPEVLAMKAFALGYSFGIKESNESIDCYTKALSDKDYMDTAEWIYGLAHSKSIVALKEEPQRESDLIEIEQLLRRVIHIDPNYSLAMLKLAKTLIKLHGINVFDEVEYWIDKALDVSNRQLSCLEEAASIYHQAHKHNKSNYAKGKDRKRNNEKAMKLYKEAEKKNPSSKRTIIGIGKCHLNNYYDRKRKEPNSRGKLREKNLPSELEEAQIYFEKDNEHKRHIDKLKLAEVYKEVSLFRGKEDFCSKAEDIYKQVIKLTEEEKDPIRLAEAYTRYATFLKWKERVKEEIDYLRKGADVTVECGEEENSDMRFSRECQDRLLFYASQGNHMTKQESLVVKAHVQRKRGHIMTSCHYLNQAIKLESTDEYKSYLREELAECTLQASDVQQTPCAKAMSDVYFDEAKERIADLDDTERKFDLELEVARKEIIKSMGQNKQLESLKQHCLKFEECCTETNKNRLKRMKEEKLSASDKNQEREKEEDRELKLLVAAICEFKCVLDGAMNTIKEQIFGKSADTKPSCYYPPPCAFKLNESKNFEKSKDLPKQMKHLLENKYKLDGFQEKLPDLFDYLIKKQPDSSKEQYKWLQDVINIRNESQHSTKSKEMLKDLFPTREKQRMLIKQFLQYAVEVNTRILSDVKSYLEAKSIQ